MKLKDEFSKRLQGIRGHFKRFSNAVRQHWLAITAATVAFIYALRKLSRAVIGAYKDVIKVSSKFETWQIQMEAFTKSSVKAKEKLQELIEFSVKTPFTPEEVLDVSALLMPLEQAGFKLKDLLTMAGNIAATYPMTFREAALNLNKALAAGMGAARLFYEQGVRAHMQTISGIRDLTKVSQAELGKIFYDIYVDSSSPLARGIKKLSQTYAGLMSTLQGEWLLFKKAVGERMFETVKADLKAVLILITRSQEQGGKYKKVVEGIKDILIKGYQAAQDFIGFLLIGAGELIDIWNNLNFSISKIINGMLKIERARRMLNPLAWVGEGKKQIKELTRVINEYDKQTGRFLAKDYSTEAFKALNKFKTGLQDIKKELISPEDELENQQKILAEQTERGLAEQLAIKAQFEEEWLKYEKQKPQVQLAALNKQYEQYLKFVEDKAKVDEWYHAAKAKIEASSKNKTSQEFAFIDELARSTARNMQTSFSNFFFKAFTGQLRSARELFAEFGRMMLQTISQLIARLLVIKMFKTMGFGGLLGFHQGGVIEKKHFGGLVEPIRAHSGTYLAPDEVPIVAQTGEGILSRRGMTTLGRDNLDRLNRGQVSIGGERNRNNIVNYYIYAVDTKSFIQLLYQNKASIHGIVGEGISSNGPLRSIVKQS
jgi:hypothetical protein